MKKIIIGLASLAVVVAIGIAVVGAQETTNVVAVSAQESYLGITTDAVSLDYGVIAASQNKTSTPASFKTTNSGSLPGLIKIKAATFDITDGVSWALGSAIGVNICRHAATSKLNSTDEKMSNFPLTTSFIDTNNSATIGSGSHMQIIPNLTAPSSSTSHGLRSSSLTMTIVAP